MMKPYFCFLLFLTASLLKAQVVINEINYNSIDTFDPGDWIELYNPTNNNINISNWTIKDEDDTHVYTLPSMTLSANAYLIITEDSSKFAAAFPGVNHIGDLGYGLGGGGDQVRLFNSNNSLIDFVEYDDKNPWPECADGNGGTLELIDYNSDNTLASSWQCGITNGSPGTINSGGLTNLNVVINEINYNASEMFDSDDWIELYNASNNNVNISNWIIKDNDDTHIYTIPNQILAANGYIIITKDASKFSAAFPGVPHLGDLGFGFGGGDQVRLFDNSDNLIDIVTYDDKDPWPLCADGSGATLELINPESDNTLPESWQCGLTHGSPGALNGSGLSNPKNNLINIEIFPNPVNHKLELNGELNGDFLITIYDVSAKRILSIKNSKLIDISNLNKGFYFLNLSSNNQLIKTLKFIKQ